MRRHALLWLLLATRLHAQPRLDDAGLDLLLLVDRSGSMSGTRAVPNVLVPLAFDLVARDAAANRVCHRFALVIFASSVRIDVPWTSVCGAEAAVARQQIDRLSPPRTAGDTDVLAALIAGRRMFDALPPARERRRAMILLTDGVPYVRNRDAVAYTNELRQFARTELQQISLDVLLLPAPGLRDEELWSTLSRDRVARLGGGSDATLAGAHRAVTRLLGNRAAQATDALVVPPYLSVIVFDILRPSRDIGVAVFAPGAVQPIAFFERDIAAVGYGDALMTVVVQRPAPGRWTFRKSNPSAHVHILSQEFFPRGRLLTPEPAEPQRIHERLGVAYAVVDADGLPLRELAGHPLSLELSLRRPDGTPQLLSMQRGRSAGVFCSREELTCDLAGRYWTEVAIRTVDHERKTVDVFRDRWSGFTVDDGVVSDEIPTARMALITRTPRAAGERMTMSIEETVGLPREFQNVLLLVALLLTLAPYLAGAKIGGLQVPALDARKRRLMKIVGPVTLLCGIALVVPFAALARPVPRLELLAADVTAPGQIDVAVANRGTATALLTKIELEVLADRHRSGRPILPSAASYRIPLGDAVAGGRKALVIRHLVTPDSVERFVISAETTRALDLRLHIHASDSTILRSDVRLGPAR